MRMFIGFALIAQVAIYSFIYLLLGTTLSPLMSQAVVSTYADLEAADGLALDAEGNLYAARWAAYPNL